ncbi:TPA: hypothetical protein ACSPQ9_005978, partial [Pseudomonas aeruginosa]
NKVNVQMDPPLANVRIDNQVKMTAPATCPAWPKLRFSPVTQFDGTTLLATGQIPQGYGEALAADARPARQWRDQGHR